MAGWNGSNQAGQPGRATSMTSPRNRTIEQSNNRKILARGLLAGVLVVVVLAAVLYVVLGRGRSPSAPQPKEPPKPAAITAVKPAPAPTNKPPSVAESLRKRYLGLKIPDDWSKPYPPQAYRPDGSLKKYSRYVNVITNKLSDYHLSLEEKTFKNGAEQHIAYMLNHEPGASLIGDINYNKHFVKSFLKSLKTPIVIEKDDSDEVVALKKAVIDAKKDLKARYDAGEDIAEIMNQTRRELKELGAYRQELEDQIRKIRRESKGSMTAKDYQDLVSAANTMLENRGCSPIKVPEMMIKRMELRDAKRAAKASVPAAKADGNADEK